MKNQNPLLIDTKVTYYSGWHTALNNYDVFQVESIKQLVSSTKDLVVNNIPGAENQVNFYFTTNLVE